MKKNLIKVSLAIMLFAMLATAMAANSAEMLPDEELDPNRNALPAEILAFPDFTSEYKNKIHRGNYQIWSERKISAWARGQGFIISRDHDSGGLQFKQGAVFLPPGIEFSLYRPTTEKGANNQTGWSLVLDIGTVATETSEQDLEFQNILRYEIYVNDERVNESESGYQTTSQGLLTIQIPYIRDPEGKVHVAIRLANHPRHFGVLYDARLEREP